MGSSSPQTPLGHAKATRADWLRAARNMLVSRGVGEVKILTLSNDLGVARSSFYWYFQNRADLLGALLEEWEGRNTRGLLEKLAEPAETIGDAVCHFFECFIDPDLFDPGLDFAVREWARRDAEVRGKIDAADATRLAAVTEIFERHGYPTPEADARGRILYFMQLGYHALDVEEPMAERMARLGPYLLGFTGREAAEDRIAAFRARVMARSPVTA